MKEALVYATLQLRIVLYNQYTPHATVGEKESRITHAFTYQGFLATHLYWQSDSQWHGGKVDRQEWGREVQGIDTLQ